MLDTFIAVFLSLLYATRLEIGYDPTVHRVEHDSKLCYVYEVGTREAPRFYRTIEPLFTARVLCITGRKTRVWRVIEVKGYSGHHVGEEMGEHEVLKDGWLDEGTRSEQENQNAIFEHLKNIRPEDYAWANDDEILLHRLRIALQNETYKKYFMEISDSRRFRKTKSRLQSAQPILKTQLFPKSTPTSSQCNTLDHSMQNEDLSGLPASTPTSISGQEGVKGTSRCKYKRKEQHRLIYGHVGCALTDADNLVTSFRAIHDAFIGVFEK